MNTEELLKPHKKLKVKLKLFIEYMFNTNTLITRSKLSSNPTLRHIVKAKMPERSRIMLLDYRLHGDGVLVDEADLFNSLLPRRHNTASNRGVTLYTDCMDRVIASKIVTSRTTGFTRIYSDKVFYCLRAGIPMDEFTREYIDKDGRNFTVVPLLDNLHLIYIDNIKLQGSININPDGTVDYYILTSRTRSTMRDL